MTGKIYFQWQNDILRKTIYPVRDLKLRHFLLYYKEIDLWAEYKGKKIEDVPKEKAEYEEAQKKAISDAYRDEQEQRKYFLTVAADTNSGEGKNEIARLMDNLHKEFKTWFGKYGKEKDESARDRKEKIFVTMRIAEWEEHRKILRQKIAKKKSLLSDPNATNRDLKTKEFEVLENMLRSLESELEQLKALVSAQNKLEKRKEEFAKRQKENLKVEEEILGKLRPLQKKIESWEADKKRVTNTIARITNPPNLDDILDYFSKADIYEKIRNCFTQGKVPAHDRVVEVVINTIRDTIGDAANSFHKDLVQTIQQWKDRGKKDPAWLLGWITGQSERFQQAQKKLDKVILALEAGKKSMQIGSPELVNRLAVINILSDAAMRDIIGGELDKLDDLQATIDYSQKTKDVLDEMISDLKSKLEKIQNEISGNKTKAFDLEQELEPVETALQITREKYLSEFVPDGPVRVKEDILPFKAEQYNTWLETLNHDQLLYEVFQRFWNEPERFPLWLQYMVIHFSGMRYASAHGSWADPKEMLLNLRILDIQEELKNKKEDELQAECEGRIASYERSARTRPDTATYLPKLTGAADKNSKEKLAYYLTGLKSGRPSDKRKAFLDLRIDEEKHEIYEMKPEEVLEELKSYEDDLPDWMWKEVVKLTDLRLTEVCSENWETLTVEEQNERLSNVDKQMGKYRDIMNQWKEKNLTGWRQEHERANQLIVTRAVCNEVAEHIQHLRGHEGAAGLTQKPLWYKREENKYYESSDKRLAGPRPYFVKAKDKNDFEIGASILWLRFVHEVPNEWRVAKPTETREGDGLIPKEYLGRNIESGGWVYKMGEPIARSRVAVTKKGSNKKGPKENQWLRWMHEATVAAVEETAEGTVVLTFETALPYEDPSLSTIGLFKRYLQDLTFGGGEDGYNAAFVGFVPEGKLPTDDLEEMLDWNHILLKEVVSDSQLEDYRKKYIRNKKPPKPTIEIVETIEPVKGKADLPICEFAKWTDGLAIENKKLYKVRIWGDKKLKGLDVNIVDTTNFQAVGLYNKETARGGVTNFLKIMRDDIDKLMALQIEDVFKQRREDWLKQKMNWLCKEKGTIYFTKEGGKGWESAESILWGTIALGGNLVQVEGEEEIEFKMEEGKKKIRMAKLVGFKKSDWYRPLDELLAEGLVHRCFCAYKGNKPRDTPKGIVYSPFFGAQGWDFAGLEQPQAFYLPFDQLVKPDEKDYVGIAQKLKCK